MIDPSTAAIAAALIAATTGIATAIYSGIRTSRASKQLAQLKNELARQKEMTLEYMRAYLNMEIEDRNQTLVAFKEMIRLVQLLREQLRRVFKYADSFNPEEAARDLTSLAKAIADCYAENQLLLADGGSGNERSTAHAIKNECQIVVELAHNYLSGSHHTHFDSIEKLLLSISEKQMVLRSMAHACASQLLEDMKKNIAQQDYGHD